MSSIARTLLLTTFALALSATGVFARQAKPMAPASTSHPSTQALSTRGAAHGDTATIKPGDTDCIRDTGSHIRRKPGHCLPVAGRSFSREQLRRTGQIDTGRALQMLDPSITVGH